MANCTTSRSAVVTLAAPMVSMSLVPTNHWTHDVEVSDSRDECVTIKSPASNVLVEHIWCNRPGGSAIGSFGTDMAIQNVLYRSVYINGGSQILMIKSWGGDGYVRNVQFQVFFFMELRIAQISTSIGPQAPGPGVHLTNITFSVAS